METENAIVKSGITVKIKIQIHNLLRRECNKCIPREFKFCPVLLTILLRPFSHEGWPIHLCSGKL